MTAGTVRRGRLRKLADRIRKIPNSRFGLRPHTVALIQTLWINPDESAPDPLPILNGGENPKVRFLTMKERYASALGEHSIEVGPITPEFDGGGYTAEQLFPKSPTFGGQGTVHYLVTGPGMKVEGSKYAVRECKFDGALGYRLVMELSETGQKATPDGE